MFARMETHIPMKPAIPELNAPRRKLSVMKTASIVRSLTGSLGALVLSTP